MDERTWAVIDLDKLRFNVRALKQVLGGVKILAVVKADAYGHGAVEISRVLKEEGIAMLGVASIDEALELKGVGLPIVILSPTGINNVPTVVAEDFVVNVTDYKFAVALSKESRRQCKRVRVHIEIDTGMERTGIPWDKGVQFVSKLTGLKNLELAGLFTHFSEPEKKDGFTNAQLARFQKVVSDLEKTGLHIPLVHTASTAAILNFPASYFNMVRPGILLYGLYPSQDCSASVKVNPILRLYTRVCQLNNVPKGTGISYGRTYKTKRRQRIATLSVGYGDGYPRSLSNKGIVLVRGSFAPIVGSVCMDLTMVDVTDVPGVKVGELVTLIGDELSADRVAELADTVNYELLTRLSPRVPRVYMKNGSPILIRTLLGNKIPNSSLSPPYG